MEFDNDVLVEQKRRIWDGAFNADKHARYYSHVANQMKVVSMVFSIVILASSSGAILSLMGDWGSPLLQSILYAVVSLAAITTVVYDFSFRCASALMIKNQCSILFHEWRRIWIARNHCIEEERMNELEYRLELVTFGEPLSNEKLNRKFGEISNDFIRATFAPEEFGSEEE